MSAAYDFNQALLAPVPVHGDRTGGETLADDGLGADLLAHLDVQLDSARRMAAIVSTQAGAIRRRAVREVVAATGELQVEMHRRELVERDRMLLMERAGTRLGMAPGAVGFTSIRRLLDPETAALAAARTDELTRLLKLIEAEHKLNRALMSQELAFLDHLLSLATGTGGYAPRVRRSVSAVPQRLYDMEA